MKESFALYMFTILPLFLCSTSMLLSLKKKRMFPLFSFLFLCAITIVFFISENISFFDKMPWLLSWLTNYFLLFFYTKFSTDLSDIHALFLAIWMYICFYIFFELSAIIYYLVNFSWGNSHCIFNLFLCCIYSALLYKTTHQHIITNLLSCISQKQVLIAGLILLPLIILSQSVAESVAHTDHFIVLICQLFILISCITSLGIQYSQLMTIQEKTEKQLFHSLLSQKMIQYQSYKETMSVMNEKCHYIKHQIADLKVSNSPEELEKFFQYLLKEISIYDSYPNTGNETINIILSQKIIMCQKNNISINSMIDGAQLAFMTTSDLYNLFSYALEQAIEMVADLSDIQKKEITIISSVKKQFYIIQFENYYDGTNNSISSNESLSYVNRSILYIAEKYNGTLSIHLEDNIHILRILLCMP